MASSALKGEDLAGSVAAIMRFLLGIAGGGIPPSKSPKSLKQSMLDLDSIWIKSA
jgi:hypothetical protein